MKKSNFFSIILLCITIFMIGCSNNISSQQEKEVKGTIDLVLSYKGGYDDTMKKHISEKNFYVCNYVEFYSLYLGKLELEKYESDINNIEKENSKYKVYMILNIEAKSLETHGDEGLSDEAVGENIPVEVVVKKKDGEFYIESFTEYENLEKAKELNNGFK